MRILLVNPPNCGRSIPEERFGITSLKQIFRGEPLALETLAGNLPGHEVRIVDLKVEPEALGMELASFGPDLVGFTAMTCEANTVLSLGRQVKAVCAARVAVGGIHASNDPEYFNRPEIDFVVLGLGKASFRELADALAGGQDGAAIPGIAVVRPGASLAWVPRAYGPADLVAAAPPRYDLVERYRPHYLLPTLGLEMGFVASAFGCPYDCSFCCIGPLAGGRYLNLESAAVVRDIELLARTPVIRLVDANSFGNPAQARELAGKIRAAGIRKQYLADVRADTVVRHPELLREWREIGLRAVVIGFEEVTDAALGAMNKASSAAINREAVALLREIGLTIVGDYIIAPDYDERQFEALAEHLAAHPVDLPMITVLTPLPGTVLYSRRREEICNHDLDYYTLTNAVLPTRLPEEDFYRRYAGLLQAAHAQARV